MLRQFGDRAISRGGALSFRRSGSGGTQQSGFTLIEVVVAFSLLALALTFLLGSLSGATRQIRHSSLAGRAALHAQTLLAQVGSGSVLKPGLEEGELDDGRYRWNLEIEPWTDPSSPSDGPQRAGATRLLELRLTVVWGAGPAERVQWRSLRLAPQENTTGMLR